MSRLNGTRARRGSRVVFVVALAVLAVGAGVLGSILYSYWSGQHQYDQLASAAFEEPLSAQLAGVQEGGEDLSYLAALSANWGALRATNPDVIGWVYLDDTPINYPVVQGGDNTCYLYVNFNGEYGNGTQATYGTPFLLAESAADFSCPVNIIQAHNMANGTMFAQIPKLMSSDTFNEHRTAYVLTPTCNYRLESIALVVCDPNDPTVVGTQPATAKEMRAYVQALVDRSVVSAKPAGPSASEVSKLFVLSTCTSDGTNRRCLLVCAVTGAATPTGAGEATATTGSEVKKSVKKAEQQRKKDNG